MKWTLAIVVCVCALAASLSAQAPLRTVKGGVLDEINLYAEKPPAATKVGIRLFSATDADITNGEKKDETKTLEGAGPGLLADSFIAKLKQLGPFSDVVMLAAADQAPDGAIIIEGKFTELDPGSTAKRALVGFGAGKSAVTVEGTVKSSNGVQLATFVQRRVSTSNLSGSQKKLENDTKSIGENIAKFLSEWEAGKNLK